MRKPNESRLIEVGDVCFFHQFDYQVHALPRTTRIRGELMWGSKKPQPREKEQANPVAVSGRG